MSIYNNDVDPNVKMWEKQLKSDIKMKKDRNTIFENWSTAELFNYLILQDVFPDDEEFDDWKNLRSELINLAKGL